MNQVSSTADIRTAVDQMGPALDAWAMFVVARISELVELEVGSARFNSFFKVAPGYRLKEPESAAKKQEKKKYAEPMEMMTDLVGARFVVLLKTDIEVVEHAIIGHTAWTKSKDRNPQDERNERPTSFDYQSVHYILRNNQTTRINGVTVPEGMACEVQIRTLLQHAYAELVHDKFYKAVDQTPQSAKRLVARCMALMETTDEMFCAAVRELESVNQSRAQWCKILDQEIGSILTSYVQTEADADAIELLDTFKHLLLGANVEEVKELKNPAIVGRIKQRANAGGLFAKPVVLLVYWLAQHHAIELSASWPIPTMSNDLDVVKADLGIA